MLGRPFSFFKLSNQPLGFTAQCGLIGWQLELPTQCTGFGVSDMLLQPLGGQSLELTNLGLASHVQSWLEPRVARIQADF